MNESADPRRRSIDIDIDYLLSYFHDFHPRGHTMRLRPEAARWMGPSPTATLRVSDAERNEVADKLSRHFADGRLDQAEFKERLDAAMSAKTQGDLAGLFDDLPPLATDPPPPPSRAAAWSPSSSWWPSSPWPPDRRSRSGTPCRSRGFSSPWWRSSSGTGPAGDTIHHDHNNR